MNTFHTSFSQGDPSKPTILALHGTGGDEHEITSFLHEILPNHNIFGVRGKVSEHGANRYFARFAEGKLDYEDLAFRTQELAEFLKNQDQLQNKQVMAIGYSNGANMAANLLLTNAFPLQGAILLRPMFLPTAIENLNLTNAKITINAGEHDQICPADQSMQLAETFTNAGAETTLNLFPTGHNLIQQDVLSIQDYFGS
ncbi:MAG: alpha/beta hydrolase [Fimbriimonadaceae bacterium]